MTDKQRVQQLIKKLGEVAQKNGIDQMDLMVGLLEHMTKAWCTSVTLAGSFKSAEQIVNIAGEWIKGHTYAHVSPPVKAGAALLAATAVLGKMSDMTSEDQCNCSGCSAKKGGTSNPFASLAGLEEKSHLLGPLAGLLEAIKSGNVHIVPLGMPFEDSHWDSFKPPDNGKSGQSESFF